MALYDFNPDASDAFSSSAQVAVGWD